MEIVVRRLRRFLLHYIKLAWKAILITDATMKQKNSLSSADSPKYGSSRPGQKFLKPVNRVTSRIQNRDKAKTYPTISIEKMLENKGPSLYISYKLKV